MKHQTLEQFIERWGMFPNNQFVEHKDWVTLYVRRTRRYVHGREYSKVLDLATLEAKDPGTGAFTRLVQHLRKAHPDLGLYVESVMNPRFREHLKKLGFVCAMDNDFSPCFFLPPEET